MSDWLRKYLGVAFAEPGEGGAAAVVDPPSPAVAADDPPAPAEGVDPPAASDPPPADHGNAGKTPWYMKRISEESAKAQREAERATAAERRAADAEALAQRLQAQPREGDAPPVAQPRQTNDNTRQADILAAATQLRMNETRQDIIKSGYEAFGAQKFDEIAANLAAAECVSDEFLADVLAANRGEAHKLLATVASDMDVASRLSKMDSRSRVAELVKMTLAPASTSALAPGAAAARGVSKAPPPAPSLTPGASKTVDWRNAESDADFSRGWEESQKNRRVRR